MKHQMKIIELDTNGNRKFWDKTALFYTWFQERRNRIYYAKVSNMLSRLLRISDNVLEIGCGSGQLTAPLHSFAAKWLATDFSPNMVKQTQNRIGDDSNVIFRVEDATLLSFPDNSFDVVIAANVLHIMPNPVEALKEIRRVLKKDGRLIAPTFIYDGQENKIRLWFLSLLGFKTFNKWNESQFKTFVTENGYSVIASQLLSEGMLTNCVLIVKPQ